MPGSAGTDTATGLAGDRGQARLVVWLLAVLIVGSVALRLWYLPAAGRQDIESSGIENIESKLAGGEIRRHGVSPLAWYPQLVALGLADRLHESAGVETLHVATAKDRLTRRGLAVARYFSVLYGALGIVLLYAIARRLHSTSVALLAALILGFSPWHIQGSVVFAPDVLIMCLWLLALWLGLRTLDGPSPARFGQVGGALGAAAAVNLTAGLIAVPVLLGLIFGGRRQLRRVLLPLAVTVPVAVLTWWLLAPPLDRLAEALELERATQVRKAAQEMSSRFTVAVFGLLHPLRQSVHGRLLGGLALLGAAGQAFRCLFLVDPGPARAQRLMVLAAAPVFILGTAWATPLFRESSFVPLVAYSSLYAAVMLAILWEALVALAPRLGSARAAGVAAALVVALVVPRGWRFVSSKAVVSTAAAALDWLRRDLQTGGPRLVFVEEAALKDPAGEVMKLARGTALQVVPRLAVVGAERLARADGEVFLRRELEGADGSLYRRRRDGAVSRRVIEGNVLWQRGPDLVAVLHPFGDAPAERFVLTVEERGQQAVATLPAADGAAAVSLVLQLPPTADIASGMPRARLGGSEIDLAPAGLLDGRQVFVSERLTGAPRPRRLQIEPPPPMSARHGGVTVAMYVWR